MRPCPRTRGTPNAFNFAGRFAIADPATRLNAMKHASIKVVVADDHPLVLHGLISLLRGEPGFEVVGACDDGVAAFEAIVHHAPDIALLDMRLPKMTGLEVLEKVSSENLKTRVVILTAFA